jgi:hypothetical protein
LDDPEIADAGDAVAVCWMRDGEGPTYPVFGLERADEIFEHLVEWAEGSPATWFALTWTVDDHSYALALIPDLARSVERYRIARRLHGFDERSTSASTRVLSSPIIFSGPLSETGRTAIHGLQGTSRVGFLDAKWIIDGVGETAAAEVQWIGPLTVRRDSEDRYLQSYLR